MSQEDLSLKNIRTQLDKAWQNVWEHFYLPSTSLIYDFVFSQEHEHRFDCLPTAEEVRNQLPNPCGWGTGMEDSTINNGAMLALICDRYLVTGEKEMFEAAEKMYRGLKACGTVHGVPGFVARSICPEDGKSVYNNSSRDQYTHYVHGLWKFYRSQLSTPEIKEEIRQLLSDVAYFMDKSVTPENDYCILMANGKPGVVACHMWSDEKDTAIHRLSRLPMCYAGAYAVTRDRYFYDQCMKYLPTALEPQRHMWMRPYVAYTLFQTVCALEVLLETMTEESECCAKIRKVMEDCSERVLYNNMQAFLNAERASFSEPEDYKDWRTLKWLDEGGYMVPQQERTVWNNAQFERECGEAILVQLMTPGYHVSELQKHLFKQMVVKRCSIPYYSENSHGKITLMAAFWKLLLHNQF